MEVVRVGEEGVRVGTGVTCKVGRRGEGQRR